MKLYNSKKFLMGEKKSFPLPSLSECSLIDIFYYVIALLMSFLCSLLTIIQSFRFLLSSLVTHWVTCILFQVLFLYNVILAAVFFLKYKIEVVIFVYFGKKYRKKMFMILWPRSLSKKLVCANTFFLLLFYFFKDQNKVIFLEIDFFRKSHFLWPISLSEKIWCIQIQGKCPYHIRNTFIMFPLMCRQIKKRRNFIIYCTVRL